ncbi:MAG: 23S rRNA (guanosine(2251)-2'-O)-methyltransferase RlmB [Pseudomonadales bacterium]|nr:23S rRNA (guanosine(2251)-2'-O)-methyltransferase RlmB [Pseudomonadales bacterium]
MSDVFGIQAVRSALRGSADRARCLYLQKGRRDARINELIGLAREHGVRFQTVESTWFRRRLSEGETHQGVLLEVLEISLAAEETLFETIPTWHGPITILVLDGITDPRNLGACLRTANGAGVQALVLPKRNSAPLNAAALKTAQGGMDGIMVVEVTNLARCLKKLAAEGFWLIGTDGEADVLHSDADFAQNAVIIMGSEDKGMRRLTREVCDQLVKIPMFGSVESLNVSVATGVILYERQRQLARN